MKMAAPITRKDDELSNSPSPEAEKSTTITEKEQKLKESAERRLANTRITEASPLATKMCISPNPCACRPDELNQNVGENKREASTQDTESPDDISLAGASHCALMTSSSFVSELAIRSEERRI